MKRLLHCVRNDETIYHSRDDQKLSNNPKALHKGIVFTFLLGVFATKRRGKIHILSAYKDIITNVFEETPYIKTRKTALKPMNSNLLKKLLYFLPRLQ